MPISTRQETGRTELIGGPVNIDELWWTYCKEKKMPAPHDLDPPAMTEAERLEKKRQDAAIGFELDADKRRMTSEYVDALTIHHTMP